MRLLVFNLVMDADDPVLGFASRWVAALAARVEHVEVVTMRAGRLDLPDNVRVHSVGKERGYSEPRRLARFYRILGRLLSRRQVDACFSHMMPLFSALGGPLLRARRIPLVTWYAHPKCHLVLKVAHRMSDRMVTSLPSAYPWRHDKLEVIGQGIELGRFRPGAAVPDEPPMVLCAGRLSPVKDHATLLRAVARLRAAGTPAFRVVLLGATMPGQEDYRASLERLVAELGLGDVVTFAREVPAERLAEWYGRCSVHVNLTPAGFGDKVAWEAMACARPSVVANREFRETLGAHADALLFPPGDDATLADRLGTVLGWPPVRRAEVGDDLRRQVERLHSLDALADRIVTMLSALRDARR